MAHKRVVVGAVVVLILGSAFFQASKDPATTDRVASSEGSVQVSLSQATLYSSGETDRREQIRSLVGNAVPLIATPSPTLAPISGSTALPTDTPSEERIVPLESTLTSEVASESGDDSVTVIGDSIALAAEADLRTLIPDLDLFAQVGLQVSGGIAALQDRANGGSLGQTVIIDLGSNGTFTPDQFDRIMTLVGPNRRIFFVNVNIPHAWGDSNNQLLAEKVTQYSNASLVDWYGTSLGHPEYFTPDEVHLELEGVKALTGLIFSALG